MDIETAFKLGRQFHNQGQWQQAEEVYKKILAAAPGHFASLHMLGKLKLQTGKYQNAAQILAAALRLKPDSAAAHVAYGAAVRQLGKHEAALNHYDRALVLDPNSAVALNNRGEVLFELKRHAEALQSLNRALKIKPDLATTWNLRGRTLVQLFRHDEALASYDRAIQLAPNFHWGHLCRGEVHWIRGNGSKAVADFSTAARLKPGDAVARWAAIMAIIPSLPSTHEEALESRRRFDHELTLLRAEFDAGKFAALHAIGSLQPFYLAYQEQNNRELLGKYGELCVKVMDRWQRQIDKARRPLSGNDNICKVGLVTAFLFDHSVWSAIVQGWVDHLDREAFELHIFNVGTKQDPETERAKAGADHYHSGIPTLTGWINRILQSDIDVLIYPELGMDGLTFRLATLRLAPIQVMTWGHPETSGLPTIDYFVSAEAFEPPDAESHYVESLACLPNLGCCYPKSNVEVIIPDLPKMKVDTGHPIFICAGTPFKYTPEHDRILIEIARRVDNAQFLFFHAARFSNLSIKLFERLAAAFATAGLDYSKHVKRLPWLNRGMFFGVLRSATVYLDTIGFSGFNTALGAVESDLPIVTREGKFMRGRLASSILQRMGMGDLVTHTDQEYVELAVRLASDRAYRDKVVEQMKTSREVLFDDPEPVRAFEKLLLQWSGREQQVRASRSVAEPSTLQS